MIDCAINSINKKTDYDKQIIFNFHDIEEAFCCQVPQTPVKN